MSSLFADSKGPNRNDPAAAATSGVLITVHSYSNFVPFPYGDAKTGGYAPNDAGLRNLGFRFTAFNGYRAGTGDEILYATKAARDPYVAPNGPTTSGVAVSAGSVTAGTNVVVSATSSDRAYGTLGPGTAGLPNPVAQNVTQGRYVIDLKPWQATTFNPMTATDGAFNSSSEGIRAPISTTRLAAGRHTVFVQGADSAGNWGPPTAVFLSIT